MTFRRWKRSSRNAPFLISSGRFLLVAAMTRTSTGINLSPPTRSTFPSSSTRSTLACACRLMSPISSSRIVPPSACSNFPMRCAVAPVNEPFSCPKSSDSMSSEGMAAQLTSTKAIAERLLARWIAFATNSFPVPLSPVIRTLASVGPTRSISERISMILGLAPRICSLPRTCRSSFARLCCSRAFRRTIKSFSRSRGFGR